MHDDSENKTVKWRADAMGVGFFKEDTDNPGVEDGTELCFVMRTGEVGGASGTIQIMYPMNLSEQKQLLYFAKENLDKHGVK